MLSCKTGVLTWPLDAYYHRPRGGHYHRHHCCQHCQSDTQIVSCSVTFLLATSATYSRRVVSITRLFNLLCLVEHSEPVVMMTLARIQFIVLVMSWHSHDKLRAIVLDLHLCSSLSSPFTILWLSCPCLSFIATLLSILHVRMSSHGHKQSASVSQNHKAQLANAYNELGKELASQKIRIIGNYTLGKVIGEGKFS